MKIISKTSALIISSLFLMASANAVVFDDTVATVNGSPILRADYDKKLEAVTAQYNATLPGLLKQEGAKERVAQEVLAEMVDEQLLLQEAKKQNIKVRDFEIDAGIAEIKARFKAAPQGASLSDEEIDKLFNAELEKEGLTLKQFRERISGQLMTRKYIEQTIRPQVKMPTEADAKTMFDNIMFAMDNSTAAIKGISQEDGDNIAILAKRFKDLSAERVRVSHILFQTNQSMSIVDKSQQLKKAKEVKKEIEGGTDFADAAEKHSNDKESAARGGDIGYIIKGWMSPDFDAAAFTIEVGKVSDPVETPFGYHLIMVTEKKARQKINYKDVEGDLLQFIQSENMKKTLLARLDTLKTKATIKITETKADAKK